MKKAFFAFTLASTLVAGAAVAAVPSTVDLRAASATSVEFLSRDDASNFAARFRISESSITQEGDEWEVKWGSNVDLSGVNLLDNRILEVVFNNPKNALAFSKRFYGESSAQRFVVAEENEHEWEVVMQVAELANHGR